MAKKKSKQRQGLLLHNVDPKEAGKARKLAAGEISHILNSLRGAVCRMEDANYSLAAERFGELYDQLMNIAEELDYEVEEHEPPGPDGPDWLRPVSEGVR